MYEPQEKWFVYGKKADFQAIAERFSIDPVTARVLRNRDILTEEEIERQLHGTVSDLYDPYLLPDMEKAAETVLSAIRSGKKIRVVGDYDIDGVCASFILEKGLRTLGAVVDHRIPDRVADGYGLNVRIVEEAHEDGVELLLTCDNGIAATEELAHAYALGMQAVVTDHHNVRQDAEGRDILPTAEAVVDVKRRDSRYPTEEICGAVTAWKLITVLYAMAGLPASKWLSLTEFAAIATIGDIMDLKGENRIIVREGLKVLNGNGDTASGLPKSVSNLGLAVLIDTLGLSDRKIDTYHIGFLIGPCMNAGGRLETADQVLRLFLTEDITEARAIALHLRELNEERKLLTERGVEEAEALLSAAAPDPVLLLHVPGLHESLCGIVAGRIKERYCRPTIVVTENNEGNLKGSGRSIESYDMFAGLSGAAENMLKFGGHPMAAGITLELSRLEALRRALINHCGLSEQDFIKKIWIDAAMPIRYVSYRLIEELSALEPFGKGFEKPVFAAKDLQLSGFRVLGQQRNVLRMTISDPDGYSLSGIMFGEADALLEKLKSREGGRFSILYEPQVNVFNGRSSIQLVIRGFQ